MKIEIKNELIRLHKLEPNIVISGSLALSLQALNNREPSDIDIMVECEKDSKDLKNDRLLEYIKSLTDVKDRSNLESDPFDIAISSVNNEGITIDIFPLDDDVITHDFRLQTQQGTSLFITLKFADWTHIVPYKIKYFTGNSKHLEDIKFIKNRLDEWIEQTGMIQGSKESQVYKQINEFLDKVSVLDDPDLPF